MRIPISRRAIQVGLAAWVLLAAGCVTTVSEDEVKTRLTEAASSVPGLRTKRVVPIYADSRMMALTLLANAKSDPKSGLSQQLSHRFSLAASRRQDVVVGGPYPRLSERIVRNALALSRHPLRGLTVVFVSPKPPSPALAQAAREAEARLYHRDFR